MLAMAGDEGLEPSYLGLEASVLAAERISRKFMAVATGVEPVFPDRQSGVLAARPYDREEGTIRYGLFPFQRSNRSLHHSSNFNLDPILAAGERIEPGSPTRAVLVFARAGVVERS